MFVQIALACFSVAFVLMAVLLWRISPIVFALMRAQVGYAKTWNDLLDAVEKTEDRVTELRSRDVEQLTKRIERLEAGTKAAPKPAPRTRRKVTA